MSEASGHRQTRRRAGTAVPGKGRTLGLVGRFAVALVAAFAAGCLAGLAAADLLDNSSAAAQAATLSAYKPSVITRVYADDGETVIGEFAVERRVPVRPDEIPPVLRDAILAAEDARFYHHVGIDPVRIAGAAWKNLTTGSREGGSTLTQQLAKNLFLTSEQTYGRKAREALLALQIERRFTKDQILEMYVNEVFLGANAYGVGAAAEVYFGKRVQDLTLAEAALLAGIPKAPGVYAPTVNREAAKSRRNLVLEQMAENRFVTREEAGRAGAEPVRVLATAFYPPQTARPEFAYPLEEIRQYLERKYTTRVAQGGLTVYTTLNVAAQKKAYESLRAGLRTYDRTHSRWRSSYRNILEGEDAGGGSAHALRSYQHPQWYGDDYEPGRHLPGLVTSVNAKRDEAAVRFGTYTATVTMKETGRCRCRPESEFRVGDLAEFEVRKIDRDGRRLSVVLSQAPEVQGAIMTINAKTGEVVAEVGGYDFETNKFNHATQAFRQTGSAFKPFVYTAAVEWGVSPDSLVSGAPITVDDGHTLWRPRNYDGSTGNADVTMRDALARSLNVPAVHLLEEVGIAYAAGVVRRFGFTRPMAPYLPSALGATEATLAEMVSAYSAFPNKGVRIRPHLVRRVLDRDGRVREEWEPATTRVTSEYVAATMVEMMRGVVERGTAARARALGVPLAGKTGTVNDNTDVWFIGYTPTYVTGVWLGYPERKRSLGRDMTGSRGALPVFIDFMRAFLKERPREEFDELPRVPDGIEALQEMRRRRMAAEREALAASSEEAVVNAPLPELPELELEEVRLPVLPAPSDEPERITPRKSEDPPAGSRSVAMPRVETDMGEPPPAAFNAQRRVEFPKKRGKKGARGTDNRNWFRPE